MLSAENIMFMEHVLGLLQDRSNFQDCISSGVTLVMP